MTKDEIRAEMRRRLRAFTGADRLIAQDLIAARLWRLPEISGARTLFLFADLPEEVSTDAIAAEALRRGIAVVYPRTDPAAKTMALHAVCAPDELVAGNYGIREPDASRCPVVHLSDVDAALVPGLAFDAGGNRLGRGAGYYDRLFGDAGWRGFRCGIFFHFQRTDALPAEVWDVPLDAVVTDAGVWRRSPAA
jgi:5-formyltetrahydrofolate cyclo-ligase